VLIPQCWSVVHTGDIKDCTCASRKTKGYTAFENIEFNKILEEKDKYIAELEKENQRLWKALEKKKKPKS
jgi:hypothetical protein